LSTTVLSGKRALITGGAQGMGWAGACAFLDAGAEVVVTDVNGAALEALPKRDGFRYAQLDVTDAETVRALPDEVGPIDIILNCAGLVPYGTLLETPLSTWTRCFAVNVTGMFSVIGALLPGMVERRSGSIINIASVASSIRGRAARCAYGASKAAVIGLTKSLAVDYSRSGVRCNCVCPGAVMTPSVRDRIAASPSPEETERFITERQLLGRLGTPEEMATLFVYLASDASSLMTGSIIVMDGGASL
jgi:2-keto-3-deoxy-L-fuconate dehydrogenase